MLDSSALDEEVCRALSEDVKTPIIAVTPGLKRIKLYFHLCNLGGTRNRPENKIVGIEGLGVRAVPLNFNMDDLRQLSNFLRPKSADLIAAATKADFKSRTSLRRGATKRKKRNFIILPPLLSQVAIENGTQDPSDLSIMLREKMTEFDESNSADPTTNKALVEIEYVLIFLWVRQTT